jgi:ABC-2 type transport system ATP-binding protein
LSDPVLVCRGLRKEFGPRVAVNDVGFQIAAGECYGLLGPNGAGKTTTISMLCGLLERDAGEITVAGRPMDERAVDAKEAIGYVPQEIALYADLTGLENLRFFGRLYGLGGAALEERIAHVLDVVSLTDRAGERVDRYSGGMQRRMNIAVGLLHQPQLLVLDEPTVGVDPQSRNMILEGVEALGETGIAVLYTTHYMEEAERLCDRIGVMDEGRLIAEGTRAELVALVGERDGIRLAADGPVAAAAEAVGHIDGVDQVSSSDGGLDLTVDGARRLLPAILEAAHEAGASVTSVDVVEPNLEAVFLHLTGKALRD